MVQITKVMLAKHRETLSPYIEKFSSTACTLPLPELPEYLATFPSRWPFPRGDLYHWLNLLNRFDSILEQFCTEYKLDEGPQIVDFGTKLLHTDQSNNSLQSEHPIGESEGNDEGLVVSILDFSRLLLENCGNRSVYASSAHLNHLLNSTSLRLLEKALHIGSQLAQRYQAALKRMSMPARNLSNGLLSNHYNINLEKVLVLAQPFSKTTSAPSEAAQSQSPGTQGSKDKDKVSATGLTVEAKENPTTVHAGDLVAIARGDPVDISTSQHTLSQVSEASWAEWGDVRITYYPKLVEADANNSSRRPSAPSPSSPPVTPSPIRRASNLGPNATRANRQSSTDDSPATLNRSSTVPIEDTRTSIKTIDIPGSKLKSHGVHTLLQENTVGLAQDIKYELLTQLRVANALTSSLESRRQVLAIRILAITNLAYIHSELVFLEKVMKQDSEEPQRLQLAFQLADLIHPPVGGSSGVPISLQTIAFSALEALAQHGSKFGDVCKALQTPVNHGVLLYVVRKAVVELSSNDADEKLTEQDQWRAALFALLSTISQIPRTGADLVTAGLIQILVDILNLRTGTAERYHPKVLAFLDTLVYNARDAFQTLVTADGLDAVSKLIVCEVDAALDPPSEVGMPVEYRSPAIDYGIPFFRQQTLKWLFKFIHHMMTTAGSFGGNFDRLLRNLIDSPPLLRSLRQIISNPRRFGSTVWTNAVSILNDFINNEPTSFAVIAEAGLSRALLETVTDTRINAPPKLKESGSDGAVEAATSSSAEEVSHLHDRPDSPPRQLLDSSSSDKDEVPHPPTEEMLEKPREGLARGILPTFEAISIIPQAFGAICLNHSGMEMFQNSGALGKFFEIFESPEHVKCMETNRELQSALGSSFDELVRHHPALRQSIMLAILDMIVRVGYLCRVESERHSLGAKLWTSDPEGRVVAASDIQQTSVESKGKSIPAASKNDVQMQDNALDPNGQKDPKDVKDSKDSMTPYVGAVAAFLSTVFSNPGIRADFSAKGGIDYVLDLVESSSLPYDFSDTSASRMLHSVVSLLAEHKAHLVVPSLLKRVQSAVDVLAPFAEHGGSKSFFEPFIRMGSGDQHFIHRGTALAKAFTNVHCLVTSLRLCLQASSFSQRNSQTSFNQMNVSDLYIQLVRTLGSLVGACLRDEISLLKLVPEEWKMNARTRSSTPGNAVIDVFLGLDPRSSLPQEARPNGHGAQETVSSDLGLASHSTPRSKPEVADIESAGFKNFTILRYLLGKMSQTVRPFFQSLGKALLNKRNSDPYQRQTHTEIAAALAETILVQLRSPVGRPLEVEHYAYWYNTLLVLKDMIVDESRQNERPVQTITVVLQAFKDQGGLDFANQILEALSLEVSSPTLPPDEIKKHPTQKYMKIEIANLCMTRILGLYAQLVNGKNVTESPQTQAMVSRQDRDRTGSDRFVPGQFLVEVRMAILQMVRRLWESDLVEKSPSSISEKLIEVIRLIASADAESGSFRRSDTINPRTQPPRRYFKLHSENLAAVSEGSVAANVQELATIALYRCNNQVPLAQEFYRERRFMFPIPHGEVETRPTTPVARPHIAALEGTDSPDHHAMDIDTGDGPVSSDGEYEASDASMPGEDNAPLNAPSDTQTDELWIPPRAVSSTPPKPNPVGEPRTKLMTVDDLNDERAAVRENLINKCLDVINAHGEVTFEIADLITTAINKSMDPAALRKDMGETLVIALMSFACEDNVSTAGNKIAAYAHLLALMLRDKAFYRAAVDELRDNLSTLLSFVQFPSNHASEEPVPWISNILLIVEMLLAEDATPVRTHWRIPKDDDDKLEELRLEPRTPIVSADQRVQLLEAILDILPRVGKDEPLALSVLRILVIVTRDRNTAKVMGEKKNIQRLFVMAKQLAGASTTRLQGPLLIILRHVIEDAETIKQAMRADIRSFLDIPRQQRHTDIQFYLRSLAHTSLRDPALFIEVTNEMVKLSRWSYPSPDSSLRSQPSVILKEIGNSTQTPTEKDDSVQPTVQATEDLTIQDVKPSTEDKDSAMPDAPGKTPKTTTGPDHKLPVIENPDGVIHFLLCELLNYKDVADKDSTTAPTTNGDKAISTPAATTGDTTMTGTSTSAGAVPAADLKPPKPAGRQEFKSEEHPIFIYRCFLLHCLTELLSSYNRTKLEFINFKRSAPPQATTPSKPRSSVVNYLLYDLVPTGSLDHAESISMRKRLATSSWAASVLTALLSKTGEHTIDKSRPKSDGEDEPDLQFVRKFVLENVLKAYKDAAQSIETLDVKYERMLALADLMSHLMTGKDGMGGADAVARASEEQLKRLMFEKGYIAALTTSVADIDLNFPGSKRAVKYILRPLKTLTATAVHLCNEGLISEPPASGDADEILSATSASDLEESREETPDLFRNSTLGMFEQGDGEETSSEEDDDEMYQGDYDDEMEYEEDMPEDDEDNISDEDEDIEGMEGMGNIEGLSGDHEVNVEVIMEEDDDDDDDDDEDGSESDHSHASDEIDDDDARLEIVDEAGNIQDVGDDDLGEWESEPDDDEQDYEAQAADEEEQVRLGGDLPPIGDLTHGPIGQLIRAVAGDDGENMLQQMEADMEAEMEEEEEEMHHHHDHLDHGGEYMEVMEEGEDEEDEEDGEEGDEDEMFFGGYAGEGPVQGFGWPEDGAQPMVINHRGHSHRPRNLPFFFPGGRDPLAGRSPFQEALDDLHVASFHNQALLDDLRDQANRLRANVNTAPDFRSAFRSHRPSSQPSRNENDGTNPLLQRAGAASNREVPHRPHVMGDWVHAMGPAGPMLDSMLSSRTFGEMANLALNEAMRSLPVTGTTRNGHSYQFHFSGPPGEVPPEFRAIIGGGPARPQREVRRDSTDPGNAASFTPQMTSSRWNEEAKLVFGGTSHIEKALILTTAIQALLVPPAIEAEKAFKAAEQERIRKEEEGLQKRREEERTAREAREGEEKAAQEKKDAEERDNVERMTVEPAASGEGEKTDEGPNEAEDAVAHPDVMDGVETAIEPAADLEVAQPAQNRPRVMTEIRGTPYDITDLGIDADFLAELPEELREEVIMSTVAERRSQAAATGAQPSDIDQEFLDALPVDIREEIVQQERQDRRRREREETRRRAAAEGAPQGPGEMDAASILATVSPALRQQILMEQDDAMIELLPPDLAAQARAMQRDHGGHHNRNSARRQATLGLEGREVETQRPQRRAVVQMLDKPGVATLLRLMFIFQHSGLRNALNSVLQNVCQNRLNRAEVVSTLLTVLQDGSADMTAVERSFAHLTIRAKLPKDQEPKTPQPIKRTLTGTLLDSKAVAPANLEASPLLVVQQCLQTLVYLTQTSPHIPSFFLTEHEISGALKRNLSRKGKAKDTKAAKYAINALLSLLDRDLIMESTSVMESLSLLLDMITTPLQALERKQREAVAEAKKVEAATAAPTSSMAPPTEGQAIVSELEAPVTAGEEAPMIRVSENEQGEGPINTNEAAPKSEEATKEPEKKQRSLTPPVIPAHNLKLVINIFVSRECNGKVFQKTINAIKNMSIIPGAKAVFGRELVTKAKALGEVILKDLEELLPQIQKATTGTQIQGVALAKFSPESSDQRRLLRVLTALDHLFDPKQDKQETTSEEPEDGSSQQIMEKQDLLSTLYNNATFGMVWEKLSACLRTIRQREQILSVATILLPLIESLMVVCKNTTPKEQPTRTAKDSMMSPVPESCMENLFLTFTEEHRKILNDLVRHQPKLMIGSFKILVQNPKVLEFDNKRNYFNRSIHDRSHAPPNAGSLQLSVRREQVFHDSFKALYFQTADQMKFGKLSIRFHNEEGVDAGGVTREWFQVLSRQMFDPGYALFIPVSSDRTTFHPNQLSGINEEHLMFFKFIGRIIGKALYEGRVLDCHFSRAVYKRILGKSVSVKDMESLDPDYYKSLVWMLENDITDIMTETFSVDNDKFGVVETVDFIPDGRHVPVTDDNKHEYVRMMVEWRLTGAVKEQLDEFLKGFHDIIPEKLISIFNEQELELLISGLPDIDVDDWKGNTEYHNYNASAPQIQWFWRAVRSFDKEERAKLLQFVTGTSKVPLNGFKELEGMNGFSRFNIHRDYGNKERLPSSHTCFNQLDLPEYESYETLRTQLLTAITQGSEYFGFA